MLPAAAWAQSGPAHRVEITLERLEGSAWRAVPPGLVLERDDRVRFRFRSNFDGYLYVMNRGTSGSYTLLFPRDETGRDNNISAAREYLIPATQAYFRIAGPPGHDVVYWVMSPVAMGDGRRQEYVPLPPPPASPPPPENLMPRCDESMLRARSLCIDSSAGPRQPDASEPLPENLAGLPGVRSRELVIMRRANQTVLSSPSPIDGPVIYEFRLAHR
jgi:5-hydroxyisourate hydrolase-like protein (transthyretin family)